MAKKTKTPEPIKVGFHNVFEFIIKMLTQIHNEQLRAQQHRDAEILAILDRLSTIEKKL
jgi:hypothetical protein